jgi:hypothetical protein
MIGGCLRGRGRAGSRFCGVLLDMEESNGMRHLIV